MRADTLDETRRQAVANALTPKPSLEEFLETVPPGARTAVSAFVYRQEGARVAGIFLRPIRLHCPGATCGGLRNFDSQTSRTNYEVNERGGTDATHILAYTCRDCRKEVKLFAVHVRLHERAPVKETGAIAETVELLKIGEVPAYGVRPSDRLTQLVETDAELFEKGLRAENEGLGIGAYAYYRRVVENQKDHLLDLIGKVVEVEGGHPELTAAIARARNTDRFTRAMEEIKALLPASLRIDGHNPLQLLFDQISADVHGATDEECLTRAAVIRQVLAGLAERVAALINEDHSLRAGIKKLMQFRNPQQ